MLVEKSCSVLMIFNYDFRHFIIFKNLIEILIISLFKTTISIRNKLIFKIDLRYVNSLIS